MSMKAAVVHDFTKPLVIEEVPKPTPGDGQIVVKVVSSGLCHTDIHAARGDWPVKPTLPFIPGHEGVGYVAEVGHGVTNVKEGDMVAMPWLGYACGHCRHCVGGWETLCESQITMGYFMNGGFADYTLAYADYVGKVPATVDPFDASPLTCAGVTTYKAVKVSGARSSDLVAVFGIGGLGHLALQYAKVTGATVVAVDPLPERLDTATELGADYTVNPKEQDPVAFIKQLGGANVVISTAVSPKAFEQGYNALCRGGKIVFVALPADNFIQLPIFETVLNGITVVGSIVGTRNDLHETFDLHAAGKTKVIYEKRKLDQVNESIEEVEHGTMHTPRLVFDMQ